MTYGLLFLATLQLLALVPPLPTPLVAAASVCAYVAIGFSGTVWDTAAAAARAQGRALAGELDRLDGLARASGRRRTRSSGPAVVLAGLDAVLVGAAVLLAAAAAAALSVPSVRSLRAA